MESTLQTSTEKSEYKTKGLDQIVLKRLRQANRLLGFFIIAIALYVILLPATPEIALAAQKLGVGRPVLFTEGGANADVPTPSANWLEIPGIMVSAALNDGDEEALKKGMWHRPNTSNPALGANTVVAAHRYLYTNGPNTFYHLDKVKVADEISVFWEGKWYKYVVSEIKEVAPDAIDIEAPTEKPILTLYTCTPLWTAEKRLVVIANLVETNEA